VASIVFLGLPWIVLKCVSGRGRFRTKIICPESNQFNKNTRAKQASMARQLCEKHVINADAAMQCRTANWNAVSLVQGLTLL
jgi:hypothetical protein